MSLALGLALGVPFSLLQVYGGAPWRQCVSVYAWFFRGIPLLVLLMLFYFGLLEPLGFSSFLSCCIILGLTSAAYQSQIFRGAIESIPAGQLKAARALGMSDSTSICGIILPQTFRRALPGWSNEFSILLKDSALVYLVGTYDITARINQQAERTRMFFEYFLVAGILYLIITMIGLKLLRRLEKRLHVPGYQN